MSDRTRLGCELLADALRRSPHRFAMCGSAVNSEELLGAVAQRTPQVVLVSDHLEEGPRAGLFLLRRLCESAPNTRAVLLAAEPDPDTVVSAFGAGAKGIFHRSGSLEALCKCILAVHGGQIWADTADLQYLLEAVLHMARLGATPGSPREHLSEREEEVMDLVARGLTDRGISQRLNLSTHTVKNYLFRIFEKLGVSTRVELVLYALDRKKPPALLEQDNSAGAPRRCPRKGLPGI